ncbi:unnamed protein product [Allacma fusca]|uniref:Uncharacterized protein n=1 Tax=Allacma fusca TaxID=39272 RepID=A0A8J2JUZ2_9HEXA|nr:unnamed protein product [Allacma fusca]
MVPTPTVPPVTEPVDRSNDDYDYYVNAVLFGATVTCYAVLLFLFCYFLWKLVRSAMDQIRKVYSCHRQGLDSSVPYKDMKEDKLPGVAIVIPVTATIDTINADPGFAKRVTTMICTCQEQIHSRIDTHENADFFQGVNTNNKQEWE